MCVRQDGRHLTDINFRTLFGTIFNNALKYLLFCVIKTLYFENKQGYSYMKKHAFPLLHPVQWHTLLLPLIIKKKNTQITA